MDFSLEALLVTLLFLLPGFLTSRLIAVRTPATIVKQSTFEETLESLLRSVVDHLLLIPVVIVVVRFVLLDGDSNLLVRIENEGVSAYYNTRPLEVTFVLLVWLMLAFLIALYFGCKWDPIEYVLKRLTSSAGTLSEDPFYLLQKHVAQKRKSGNKYCQLWVQAKLKNNCIYQGEFVFIGYRDKDTSRELLLKNVRFLPSSALSVDNSAELYDFALIDVANCDSLDVSLTDTSPV